MFYYERTAPYISSRIPERLNKINFWQYPRKPKLVQSQRQKRPKNCFSKCHPRSVFITIFEHVAEVCDEVCFCKSFRFSLKVAMKSDRVCFLWALMESVLSKNLGLLNWQWGSLWPSLLQSLFLASGCGGICFWQWWKCCWSLELVFSKVSDLY